MSNQLFQPTIDDIKDIAKLYSYAYELPLRGEHWVTQELPKIVMAKAEDVLVGCVGYDFELTDMPIAWIKDLLVSPKHRKEGYGAFLMTEIFKRLGEFKPTVIQCKVKTPEQSEWFKKFGFQQVDKEIMRKTARYV